ncbi:MAG: hypothetical protein J6B98_02205 [Bacilli bacterium]|nr:hypothetical protein [Bacilli bacterium]
MKREEKRMELITLKNKIATYALIGGLGISSLLTGCSNEISEEDKAKIETAYGLESDELTVITYLELSNELNKLNLEKYGIEVTEKTALDTPENIQLKMEKLDDIKYLMQQEENINYYLRTNGYKTASEASLEALKSYVKESMGLKQTDDIEITIDTNSVTGYENIVVYANGESHIIELKYLDSSARQAIGNYLNTNVESYEDVNEEDNYKYNKDRNQIICDALVESSELKEEVISRDLSNPRLIKKLTKN